MEIKEITDSSVISKIGYDETSQALLVGFKNGAEYIYNLVSKEIYEKFLKAESKGSFMNCLRENYKCRKIN